jgi:hypothetical protein
VKSYAGIGSRETPYSVCEIMTGIARDLHDAGWWLRSGGALRANRAFEMGAGEQKQIFLAKHSKHHPDWYAMAEQFHPAWERCNPTARALHARNCPIVLGENLDDAVNFIACWTPDGKASGGTGQALRVAAAHGIKVFNLFDPTAERALLNWAYQA